MNKIAHYLQQHVDGEVVTSDEVLDYFSTDESVLQQRPMLVLYPRSERDIRKTARFTWQLAEKGRSVAMTARGSGTDTTGGSLGDGICIAMTAHMNKIIELDPKSGVVVVEAGILLDKLQQVLHTHGRFLPVIAENNRYGTIGGAVANNDSSRYSYKYGPMQEFVRGLKVVLANGELIETGRLSKRELNKKLGLASFEGELYRALDKVIEDGQTQIDQLAGITAVSKAGYSIADVKQKDGSFDLTPLFIGSQGSLGVITEVILDTAAYTPRPLLFVAGFSSHSSAWKAVSRVNELKNGPSSIDFVDESLLTAIQSINPGVLKPLEGGVPAVLLFFEFDDESPRTRKKLSKKVQKVLEEHDAQTVEPEEEETSGWLRLRDSASMYITSSNDKKRALPVLDDGHVPVERMSEFFNTLPDLMSSAGVTDYAVWGQAGNGLVHTAPRLDISSVGDRQKLFKLMDAYYGYVCELGGSIAAEYAEGRLRGAMDSLQFSPDQIELFTKIKHIFDPGSTLNTGVKFAMDKQKLKSMIRSDYRLDHQHNHLPRG